MNQSQSLLQTLTRNVATLGPIGLCPRAPGTLGSLLAVLAAPWLFLPLELPLRILLLAGLFVLGGWTAGVCEQMLACKDPGQVVIDEVVGQWMTILFLPQAGFWSLLLGFCLFRLLDIHKPGPIRASESWFQNGFGAMIDDLLAGIAACALLSLVLFLVYALSS